MRASRDAELYDAIGVGYQRFRQPDVRIERMLHEPLGHAAHVVNVGAGPGSYEPRDRTVIAVEPSLQMIRQRPPGSAPAIRAVASTLPFPDAAFDAAMALLTVHHWPDSTAGLQELRRVTHGPIVVFTFDHDVHGAQWLVTEYLPSMLDLDRDVPSPYEIAETLGGGRVDVIPIAADCVDGFCHAWWQRPHAYLDPAVRAAISGIARLPRNVVEDAMAHLRADLASGAWNRRHRDLLAETEIDAGYRVVVAPGTQVAWCSVVW
jgi:SAM-dependent methyltransferase